MRLTLRVLGLDLLDVEFTTDSADDAERDLSGGSTTADFIGFTPSSGTQRWEPGADL